jgi:hypothetical protein
MKRLRQSLASILIVSALVLSDAKSGLALHQAIPNQRPKSKASQAKQHNLTSTYIQPFTGTSAPSPSASGSIESIANPETDQTEDKKEGDWTDVRRWCIWDWPWTNILLVVFNGLLVVITWLLVQVGWKQAEDLDSAQKIAKDSTTAAKASAEASKQSANIANLALHIDRPFLVPDKFSFSDGPLTELSKLFQDENVKKYMIEQELVQAATIPVSFLLKNYGKGPAVLSKILGRIAVIKSLNELPISDFSECEEWAISRAVFGIGDESSVSSPILALIGVNDPKAGSLSSEELCAIVDSESFLVVYGHIIYSDLFNGSFSAEFFWMYSCLPPIVGSSAAFRGPRERNRFT